MNLRWDFFCSVILIPTKSGEESGSGDGMKLKIKSAITQSGSFIRRWRIQDDEDSSALVILSVAKNLLAALGRNLKTKTPSHKPDSSLRHEKIS